MHDPPMCPSVQAKAYYKYGGKLWGSQLVVQLRYELSDGSSVDVARFTRPYDTVNSLQGWHTIMHQIATLHAVSVVYADSRSMLAWYQMLSHRLQGSNSYTPRL